VINLRREADFRRFEGIINREGDRKEENTAGIWGFTLSKYESMCP
jgi:hypothetical protein